MWKNQNNPGFTLVELLVVISVIGLLSSVILVSTAQARINAMDARRVLDINEIQKALELFYADHGYYPSNGSYPSIVSFTSFWQNVLGNALSPYMNQVPIPPEGACCSYVYEVFTGANPGGACITGTRIVNQQGYFLLANFHNLNGSLSQQSSIPGEYLVKGGQLIPDSSCP